MKLHPKETGLTEVAEFTPAWEVHKDDPQVIAPQDGHCLIWDHRTGIYEVNAENSAVGLWTLPTIGHISFKED